MSHFHWTSLEIGTSAWVAACMLAWFVGGFLKHRSERKADASPRCQPGDRYVVWPKQDAPVPSTPRSVLGQPIRIPARDVFGPLAANRIPPRPKPRFPAPPVKLSDEAAVSEAVDLLLVEAKQTCVAAAEHFANLELMAEYADKDRYPLKQRPEPAEAAPGEPWKLPARLVEQARAEFTNPQENS